MNRTIEIVVHPTHIQDPQHIDALVQKELLRKNIPRTGYRIVKKSVDARSVFPIYRLQIALVDESFCPQMDKLSLKYADQQPSVIIVGAGPAGYFSALELLSYGIKPIIIERGKDVYLRRNDVKKLLRNEGVNINSNFCFGEGGAGAYSDGKLTTRSNKRGDITKVHQYLVKFGASENIFIDAHPHIGSEKLPKIIQKIRQEILNYGGEIYFDTHVVDLIIQNHSIKGVRTNQRGDFLANAVILATGHSARDIFELFLTKNIMIEPKPFAMGVRVEHPQELIDQIRYHHSPRHPNLPPAEYRIACQIDERGVYSFCMCPGGHIVPTPTEHEELVVNGMSYSSRSGRFANAGIVVEVRVSDAQLYKTDGNLVTLAYQKWLEKKAFEAGGRKNHCAPAQRMTDFISGKLSASLPKTSYLPGIFSAPLHEILPEHISFRLQKAFKVFDNKLKGFLTQEAVLVGVESRTSSPIRIPRDPLTLMHPQINNLYPCGEGSGFAGGIVSSAMDGINIAKQIAITLKKR